MIEPGKRLVSDEWLNYEIKYLSLYPKNATYENYISAFFELKQRRDEERQRGDDGK